MPVRSPLLALQGALHGRLSGHVTVYDAVPQKASFPYVTIGEATATDWGTKTGDGTEVTVTVHTWSRYHGRKECLETMDTVLGLVTGGPLALAGFSVVTAELELLEVLEEPDGITRHGVQKFRFRIEEV